MEVPIVFLLICNRQGIELSGRLQLFGLSVAPYSEVVLTCDDNHENMEGHLFKWLLGFYFYPHLMWSGSTMRVVVTWPVLSGGCLCFVRGTFGFLAGFQFPKFGFLKLLIFLSSSSLFHLLPFLLCIFLFWAWSFAFFFFLSLTFWGTVSLPFIAKFICLSFSI